MTDKYYEVESRKVKMSDVDSFLELLQDKTSDFDVSALRNEGRLRELIMNKVLDTAIHNFKASNDEGDDVLLAKLPEDLQEEHLEKLMMKILGDVEGPGPVLRHRIAKMVLHYRILLRLREMLPTLQPTTPKHRHVTNGIAHIESNLRVGMLFMDVWPMFAVDAEKLDIQALQQQMLKSLVEEVTSGKIDHISERGR